MTLSRDVRLTTRARFPAQVGAWSVAPRPGLAPLPVVVTGSEPDTTVHVRHGLVCDRNARLLNVLVAAVGIVLTLPVMGLIALAVRLSSAGPVLYRQPRVGHDRRRGRGRGRRSGRRDADMGRRESDSGGRIFTIYKFRTMNAGSNGGASQEVWAGRSDPRITPLGSVLRRYRLDELPQLFNVLRGDMNVVGPRPEQPVIFSELRRRVARYSERQAVLPGITGWAQVNRSYDQSVDDVRRKVEFDLEYIGRRSSAEDLRIMVRTLPVMVGKRGAL